MGIRPKDTKKFALFRWVGGGGGGWVGGVETSRAGARADSGTSGGRMGFISPAISGRAPACEGSHYAVRGMNPAHIGAPFGDTAVRFSAMK